MEGERTRLQKLVLIALAAMAVVFGVLTGVSRLHRGAPFDGGLLYSEETAAGETVYAGKVHGEAVRVTVAPLGGAVTEVEIVIGDRLRDVCRVEYPLAPIRTERDTWVDGLRVTKNGEVLFAGGYDPEELSGWYAPDGTWEPQTSVRIRFGSDPWSGYETDAISALFFALGPKLVARGSFLLYFMMVFFSVFVALDAAFPLALFRLRHCCDVRDPEPTDFYMGMLRVGWVVWLALLLIGYIWALRALP